MTKRNKNSLISVSANPPIQEQKPNKITLLSNNGNLIRINIGMYYSFLNNGFIKKNEKGEEILDVFVEKKKNKNNEN